MLNLDCCFSAQQCQDPRDLVIFQENEAEPEIYHHYYQLTPYLSHPPWLLPQATVGKQEAPNKPSSAPSHRNR